MATNVLEFLITAKDEASEKLKGLSDLAPKLGAAFTVAGGAITGALTLAVKAAAEAEVQNARTQVTLERAVDSFNNLEYEKLQKQAGSGADVLDFLTSKIEATSKAAIKLGFDDEDTAASVAVLFQRTKDMTEAQRLNGLAMDLARAKNIDLASATTLVGQVLSGNGKVLKQYGIDIKDSATPLEALGELQAKVGGQATAFSQTLQGQTERLQVTFGNLTETIGEKLIPIIQELLEKYILPTMDAILEWADANPELTKKIVMVTAAVGGLMLVLGPLLLALPALTIAFGIIAGPIGIVIAIIVALGVAVYNIVNIIILLRDHWKEIWLGIKEYTKEVVDAIIGYFQPLIDVLTNVYNKVTSVFSAIGGSVKSAVGSAVSSVKSIAGFRASGGNVRGGSTYVVGENGPELFTASSSGFISPNGSFGGGQIVINMNGGTYLDERVAVDIGNMIVRNLKRVSKLGL